MKIAEIEKKLRAIKRLEEGKVYKAKAVYKPYNADKELMFMVTANGSIKMFSDHWGIKGVFGGFNTNVWDALAALEAFGRITKRDVGLFDEHLRKLEREREKESEIEKMRKLASKYGYKLVEPKKGK